MAGTKNRNKNLERLKNPSKSAIPVDKTLFMFGNIHKKSPVTMRNTPMKM